MLARRLLLVLTLASLAMSSCSAGGSEGGEDCDDLSKEGDTFAVTIENFEFTPSCFTASASQSIRVHNADDAVHSFTLQGTDIDVDIAAGETFEARRSRVWSSRAPTR